MNLWVLFLCRIFLHSRVKTKRIILGALLAALGEAILLCIPVGSASIKLMLGFGGITAFIVSWLFQPETWKYYEKMLIYSYLSATLMGGALVFFESILGEIKVSLGIWSILVVFLYMFMKKIYGKISVKSEFCNVVLNFSEKEKCTLVALIDSGNGLLDPISKQPVSLIEERIIKRYKGNLQKDKFRVIPYHSVGNTRGVLEAYFMEKMVIEKDGEKKEIQKPLIAITKDVISVNERYQMILHPTILK